MRPKIYIIGPITKGDRDHNFNQAAEAHRELLGLGFAVFNPMLSMKLPGAFDIDHSVWLASDRPWIEAADAVFVLLGCGDSDGAMKELRLCYIQHKPEFYNTDDLLAYFWMERTNESAGLPA